MNNKRVMGIILVFVLSLASVLGSFSNIMGERYGFGKNIINQEWRKKNDL